MTSYIFLFFFLLMNLKSAIRKFSNGSKSKLNAYVLLWIIKTSLSSFSCMRLQYFNMFAVVVHVC